MLVRLFAGTLSALLVGASAAAAFPPAAYPGSSPASAAPAPAEDRPQMVVSGDKLTRTVDCDGARAMITASDGALSLKRCAEIVVAGNHERVNAQLLPESSILVLGDHDVVRWTASPGSSPYVRDQGHRNVTAPF